MGKLIIKEIKIIETSRKHLFRKDRKGEIDTLAWDWEHCNGPVCVKCGHTFCEHCNPKGYDEDCQYTHHVADNGKIYQEISDKY